MKSLTVFLVAALLCLIPQQKHPLRAEGQTVDLKLVLGIDCSYSVDEREFALQIQGLARAFRDPGIVKAIRDGPYGRIAVTVVQWSDERNQRVGVPWTVIAGDGDAAAFSQNLAAPASRRRDINYRNDAVRGRAPAVQPDCGRP